jgi:hypothetical protein
MGKIECPVCTVIDCCVPSGLDDYLLVGQSVLNNSVSIAFDCPEGYVCDPGVYPIVITIPRGRLRWSPPPIPPINPLRLNCCDGVIIRSIPEGISQSAYQVILQDMADEWARREAGCEEKRFRAGRVLQSNDAQTVNCANDTFLANISGGPLTAFLPGSVKMTVDGKGLTLAAGVFRASTKSVANAQALAFLTKIFNTSISNGKLACYSCEGSGCITNSAGWTTFTAGTATASAPGSTVSLTVAESGLSIGQARADKGVSSACDPYSVTFTFALSLSAYFLDTVIAVFRVDGVTIRSASFQGLAFACTTDVPVWAPYTMTFGDAVHTVEFILQCPANVFAPPCASSLAASIVADCKP